jgi:hypothetical protein
MSASFQIGAEPSLACARLSATAAHVRQLAPGAADSVTDRSIYELENTMRSDSRGHVSVTCIHQINHM